MLGDLIYLYGVMAADTARVHGLKGVGGKPVHVRRCGEFAALISQVHRDQISLEADSLLAHERVLTQAMEVGTVIPAAFGHLIETEAALCNLLLSVAESLRANLEHLHGRVEVGVKGVWPREHFLADIQTPELQAVLEEAADSDQDPDLALGVGELVEQLADKRREEYVATVVQKLSEVALETRLNDTATSRMIFNAAFLIDAAAQDTFLEHLKRIVTPYPHIEFHYSGPWPPHNFSRLRIEK